MPKFDVFLSHNSVDKPWVINLKQNLEEHDITVWLDKDEIRPGDLFAEALETGLASSKCMVLVVSPESMKSGWVKKEYYRALSLSTKKKQSLRLIPVVLRTAKVPGFLADLHRVEFTDDTKYFENLEKLIWGIKGTNKKKIEETDGFEIPLVIVAMNKDQSIDLLEKSKFNDPDFAKLISQIPPKISITSHGNYGDKAENWKYPQEDKSEFTELVIHTFYDLNLKLQESTNLPILKPRFYTDEFFSTDFAIYMKTWEYLKERGCILIVDAISLFHPEIRKRLNDFHIEANDNTAVLIISPIDSPEHSVAKIVEKNIHDHLQMAYAKYDIHLDKRCDFGINNLRGFKRWIYATLPDIANGMKNKKSKLANRELVRKKMGIPTGIADALFGTEGAE